MSRKKAVPRDTAKDIILGLAPSGAGPREPREGIAQPIDRSTSKLAATPQPPLISPQIDPSAIVNLQNLFSQFQRQYNQFVNANQQKVPTDAASLQTYITSFECFQEALESLLKVKAMITLKVARTLESLIRMLLYE
uniref:Gag-pol polyprotein n=1 Tax=Ascaris lumbricoides TaxID=6252 RepID=A0A0M3HQ15_ASCLU